MRIELIPVAIPPPGGPARTPGIHLSRVLKSLHIERGLLSAEYADALGFVELPGQSEEWWHNLDISTQTLMCMGLAWEAFYLPLLDIRWQPGEMHLDGIYLTPDGESLDMIYTERGPEVVLAIHEVKLTYQSTNTVGAQLEGATKYLNQLGALCKAAGTTLGFLHVLFVLSNYGRPFRPIPRLWRVEFTQEEMDHLWKDIVTHAYREGDSDGQE